MRRGPARDIPVRQGQILAGTSKDLGLSGKFGLCARTTAAARAGAMIGCGTVDCSRMGGICAFLGVFPTMSISLRVHAQRRDYTHARRLLSSILGSIHERIYWLVSKVHGVFMFHAVIFAGPFRIRITYRPTGKHRSHDVPFGLYPACCSSLRSITRPAERD
jgi:hypothetical protein